MSGYVKIKRGLNINLAGEAKKTISDIAHPETFAIRPDNFAGFNPKLLIKEGDEVLAGSPIFYDKSNEAIKISSPVSGEIVSVVRGDKRKILEVKILADREIRYLDFGVKDPHSLTR